MGERVRLWPFIRIYVYSDSGPPIYLNKFMTLSAKWQLMRDFRSQHEHVTGVSAAQWNSSRAQNWLPASRIETVHDHQGFMNVSIVGYCSRG